ncbi:hypothetical protein H9Q74_005719 [Fusarium xylarioides]|nr:hypothetical protein H9Q71_005373 [Fusarium xylarioides]KAG5824162.1 hypothetical protein H9Q74_005719 [Fusarium xylarioides]
MMASKVAPTQNTEPLPEISSSAVANVHDTPDDASVALSHLLLEMEEDPSDASKIDEFSELLKGTTDDDEINYADGNGQTPLHIAARCGFITPVAELLERNIACSIRRKDNEQREPIHDACLNGNPDIVKMLLNSGADIEAPVNCNGSRPLHEACWSGVHEVVDLLLTWEKPADPGAIVSTGWTPLYVAVHDGHEEIVKRLLRLPDQSLNINTIEKDSGFTTLNLAIVRGNQTIVSDLLGRADIEFLQDMEMWTPLYTATEQQEPEIMEMLLNHKSGNKRYMLEIPESRGFTPLLSACAQGYTKGVQLLLSAEADCNALSDSKSTPLIEASRGNHIEIIEALLATKKPAKIDHPDAEGRTALHVATYSGNYKAAMLLIKEGAKMDSQDDFCRTLLSYVFMGHGMNPETTFVVDHIVKSGSGEQKDKALMWAAGKHARHEVAKLLLSGIPGLPEENKRPYSKDWDSIEWAAYRSLPHILLLLIASSPPNTISKSSVDSALRLAQEEQSGDPKVKSTGGGVLRNSRRTDEDKEKKDKTNVTPPAPRGQQTSRQANIGLVKDILQDPAIFQMQIHNDSGEIERPVASKDGLAVMKDWKATIVQLYKEDGRSAAIPRVLEIKDVIYDKGPTALVTEANLRLKRIINKTLKNKDTEVAEAIKRTAYINSESRLGWIHLPATNDLVTTIMRENPKPDSAGYNKVRAFLQDSWVEIPDSASSSRTMRPRFVKWPQAANTEDVPETRTMERPRKELLEDKHETGEDEMHSEKRREEEEKGNSFVATSATYMPYLSLSSQCRKEYPDQDTKDHPAEHGIIQHPNAGKTMCKIREAQQKHAKLVGAYPKMAVHYSPTLDEWYYHFATDEASEDRKYRNENQVVTKSLKSERSGSETEHWRLIRINQLWMWTIGDGWIITAANDPIDGSHDTLLNGILGHLKKLIEAGGSELQPDSVDEMGRLIVDYCIGLYEMNPKEPKDLDDSCKMESVSIRQMFSNSINIEGRKQARLIKQFTSQPDSPDCGDKSHALTGTAMREASRNAENLSYAIKDIRDELNILKSVVNYQKVIQQGLERSISKDKSTTEDNLTAAYILSDIEEMDDVAKRIESAVDTARSLQQGQESMPLSFLTSLFALDVASFQKAPAWALVVIFSVSLTFFVPLASYANYLEEIPEWTLSFWTRIKNVGRGRPKINNSIIAQVSTSTATVAKEVPAPSTTDGRMKDAQVNVGEDLDGGILKARAHKD